jgi:hypothetical protein
MHQAFRAFCSTLKRVFSDASTWAGAVSTGLGLLSDFLGYPILVPSSVWWLLAVALLLVAAFRAHWELLKEREKNRNLSPTMSLQAVLQRIVGSNDVFGPPGNPQRVSDALRDIRQKAVLRAITVWGRKNANLSLSHPEIYPLQAIPCDYWEHVQIAYLEVLKDIRGKTELASRGPHTDTYADFHFDKHQIDEFWPARSKWRFRNPLVRAAG